MTFQGALELAEFPIPDFEGCVFRAGGEGGEDGVECDAVDGRAVGLEGMSGGRARKPGGWVLVSA